MPGSGVWIQGVINKLKLGQPFGVATLDGDGHIPSDQLPISAFQYKGFWDASANDPHLENGIGSAGDFYQVSVAGTQNLGAGSVAYNVHDALVYNGSTWDKIEDPAKVSKSGDTMTGPLVLFGDPEADLQATTRQYADRKDKKFEYPADGSLTSDDLGKLMMNDGSNTAKVYEGEPGIASFAQIAIAEPSLPDSYINGTLTVAEVSQTGTPVTRGYCTIHLASNPNVGDDLTMVFFANEEAGGGYSLVLDWTFKVSASGNDEVTIGLTPTASAANLAAKINSNVAANASNISGKTITGYDSGSFSSTALVHAVASGPDVTISITDWQALLNGAVTQLGMNSFGTSVAPPRAANGLTFYIGTAGTLTNGRIDIQDTDANGWINNAVAEVIASQFSLTESPGGEVAHLIAGIDWTPGGNTTDDATAIRAALATALTGTYTVGGSADFITFERTSLRNGTLAFTNFDTDPADWLNADIIAEVLASTLRLDDTNYGTVFNIKSGVDWTPGGDSEAEAIAILAALSGALTAAGWTGEQLGSVLTFTANLAIANPITFSTPGALDGEWATLYDHGDGFNEVFSSRPIGTLYSFNGGKAILQPVNGTTLIASGSVIKGDYLKAADDGKVATLAEEDVGLILCVGTALNDAADDESVQIGYAPFYPNNWQYAPDATTPRSIEEALEFLKDRTIGERGGLISVGGLTIDHTDSDSPTLILRGKSANASNIFEVQDGANSNALTMFLDHNFSLKVGGQQSSTKITDGSVTVDYNTGDARAYIVRNTSEESYYNLSADGNAQLGVAGAHTTGLFTQNTGRFVANADGSLECFGNQLLNAGYTPDDSGFWDGDPTTIKEAIDRLAAIVGLAVPIPALGSPPAAPPTAPVGPSVPPPPPTTGSG